MIRGVLGSRASIGGVLGSGRGGAAAAAWYLAGGVSAANAIAVYQPIGAASLAASYTNLANPGTFNAAPGVAPTFNTATGWSFATASSQYLTTGITPTATTTVIVRLSDAVYSAVANAPIIGSGTNGAGDSCQIVPINTANNQALFSYGTFYSLVSKVTSGVMALAAANAYIDGSSVATVPASFTGAGVPLIIGGHNNAGTPGRYVTAKVQAIAMYNTTLTAPQVAAISAAMAAL